MNIQIHVQTLMDTLKKTSQNQAWIRKIQKRTTAKLSLNKTKLMVRRTLSMLTSFYYKFLASWLLEFLPSTSDPDLVPSDNIKSLDWWWNPPQNIEANHVKERHSKNMTPICTPPKLLSVISYHNSLMFTMNPLTKYFVSLGQIMDKNGDQVVRKEKRRDLG